MEATTCFECGQPGHFARNCPDAGVGENLGPADADAPWCGGCDQRTRHTTDADGREHRCRRCWLPRMAARGHPDAKFGLQLAQSREMDPATKLQARWYRETDYGARPASPELMAEMEAWATSTATGAEMARQVFAARPVQPGPGPALHGEALAAAQLAEAASAGIRAPTLPPPAPGEEATPPAGSSAEAARLEPAGSSANGHRAGADEFPF